MSKCGKCSGKVSQVLDYELSGEDGGYAEEGLSFYEERKCDILGDFMGTPGRRCECGKCSVAPPADMSIAIRQWEYDFEVNANIHQCERCGLYYCADCCTEITPGLCQHIEAGTPYTISRIETS